MGEDLGKLEMRIVELENQLEALRAGAAPDVTDEELQIYEKVQAKLARCWVCDICTVCTVCITCIRCYVCDPCIVECSCGPCNIDTGALMRGGAFRFRGLGG